MSRVSYPPFGPYAIHIMPSFFEKVRPESKAFISLLVLIKVSYVLVKNFICAQLETISRPPGLDAT